jgi:uncharacterized protein YhdP
MIQQLNAENTNLHSQCLWQINDKTLFDGNLINKAAVFKYKITGAWDKPIIKEQ